MTSDDGKKKPSVEYNWLGPNCGIKVSNLCLGTMTFGTASEAFSFPGNTDVAQSHAILDRFHELGGNFIDTANIYTDGRSEEIIGSWLKKHNRSDFVIATKVRFGVGQGGVPNDSLPNDGGLSRGAILANLEASLKRLDTDYLDILYAHCWDAGVKIEETLRTFNDVVRSGKVRYVAWSNVTGAQLQKIVDHNKFLGFDQCVALEQGYSMLERYNELEVIPTCKSEGIGLVTYSPLVGGLLTGKFKRDAKQTDKALAGTRMAWAAEKPDERSFSTFAPNIETFRNNEDFWKLLDALSSIAKKHGKTQSQVAIRWVLQKEPVSSVIIGAKNIQQLEDNMGAGTGWKLTDEQVKQLDDLSSFSAPAMAYPYTIIAYTNMSRARKF